MAGRHGNKGAFFLRYVANRLLNQTIDHRHFEWSIMNEIQKLLLFYVAFYYFIAMLAVQKLRLCLSHYGRIVINRYLFLTPD